MAAPPTKIMLIRHGEKPPKSPGKDGPFDVQENGTPGGGKSLIVQGWQRAGALNAFFAPYHSKPSNPDIATPNYIYAANPNKESARPCESVTPLAAWLGYKQGSPQFNVNFDIGGGEKDMVKSVMGLDGVVLICWEHDHIMPNIIDAIQHAVPIANYSSMPSKWPDVFYLVWVLNLQNNAEKISYLWQQHKQNLIQGDV